MKKLPDCAGAVSWFFIAVAGIVPLAVLLHPTFIEILIFLLVDSIVFFINVRIEGPIFEKLYPDIKIYFKSLEIQDLKQLSLAQQVKLFESFMKFPRRRATYASLGSFIKAIPAMVVIVFVWKHQISNVFQFTIMFGIFSVLYAYFYGAVFIEAHIFLSQLIKKIHKELNWSEVFEAVHVSKIGSEFEFQEMLVFVALGILTFILQWRLIVSTGTDSTSRLSLNIFLVSFVCFVLIAHIWYLGRQYFMGGLSELFLTMDGLNYEKTDFILPLHTNELLARFEKSFNLLMARLRASEQEIAGWVLQEADKSRFRALGEMSALIAHDLSTPLHVVQFCVDSIIENPENAQKPQYIRQLSTNTARAIELIESLRARLKNQAGPGIATEYMDAHGHVMRILETQFFANEFSSIHFVLDPALKNLLLHISRVDLIHVLDNVYRNAVENLLDYKIENPEIRVDLIQGDTSPENENVSISVRDNGTGMAPERFSEMTAFQFMRAQPMSNQGLGLKLTRRLIELNGGKMNVIKVNEGTCFKIDFKGEFTTAPMGQDK